MTNQQQLIQDYGMKAVKIALFVLAVFLLNTTADAQVEAGKQFQIVALHSNKCVDVSEVSTKNGQAIHQFKCLNTDNQNWQFEPKQVGNEVAYTIKARHSGKCLDVEGGKTGNGTPIIQWDCTGGNNQLWIPKEVGGGYQLKSVQTGKCLDVRGPSVDDGAKMQIWDCGGASQNNQLFKLPLLTTVANIEFKSYVDGLYATQADSSGNYAWLGGPKFTREVLNPLDGGVLLRYTQDVEVASDGCSNKFPDLYNAIFRKACFAHDANYDAPFQAAGFPNYESDSSPLGSIGRDLADYIFLKDMLFINKEKYGGRAEYSLGESAAYGFFRGVQDFVGLAGFGEYRGKRGTQTVKDTDKGGVVALKNYGGYVARLRVTWTSPTGVRKVEEVLNGGGRAAAIPLSIGARDIDVEITAVGRKEPIVKKSYPTVGMYSFTVGGDLLVKGTDWVEGSLKASFGDTLTEAFRGKAAPAGQRAIRFNHEAGFVADMTVLYFVNENIGGTTVPLPKSQSTPKLTAGFARTLVIPNELAPNTNIQVTITGYGTLKNSTYTTTVPADFKDEPCFKAYNDFGNPLYGKCK